MSKVANSIRRGLLEAIAVAEGKVVASAYRRVHVPDRIKYRGAASNQHLPFSPC